MIVQFNNLNLADESRYLITSIDGWDDMPDTTNGSAVRPRRHGSWPGGMLAPKRVVTIDLQIVGDRENGDLNTAAFLALKQAVALSDTERPLIIDLGFGLGGEQINARVSAVTLPTRQDYYRLRNASIEFTATDPLKYSTLYSAQTLGLRTRKPIPAYPIRYPKPYVRYGNPGDVVAINTGGAATPPTFTFTGPLINPGITINDGLGTRKISFNMSLGRGRQMAVSTLDGTATVGGTSFYGDSRGALIEDMVLRPGASTIHFTGSGAGSQDARLQVAWRSANL